MKNATLLTVISVLAMAMGCNSPAQVRHQRAVSPEFARDRNAQWGEFARPQQPPSAERTYMGVRVVPAPEALRAQLSLPEGAGLVVTAVAPHSPAAEAKLAQFDVLTRINQQYLINPEQFKVLVRDAKPGQQVRLTFIRQARLATVMVKLGSHKAFAGPMGQGMPAHPMPGAPMGPGWGRSMPGAPMGPGWGRPMPGGPTGPGMWGQGIHGGQQGPNMPGGSTGPNWGNPMPGGNMGPGMRGPGVVVNPDGSRGPAKRPGPAAQDRGEGYQGEMIFRSEKDGGLIQGFRDNEYVLRLVTDRNGKKTLTARDIKNAEVVFEGPINTPAERAKLPVPVRRRLEQIERTPKFAPPAR